jgi:hypothetical protein
MMSDRLRPFEERIRLLRQIKGGSTPKTGIWIVGELAHTGGSTAADMFSDYNQFNTSRLYPEREIGESEQPVTIGQPVEYVSFIRYLKLLEKDHGVIQDVSGIQMSPEEQASTIAEIEDVLDRSMANESKIAAIRGLVGRTYDPNLNRFPETEYELVDGAIQTQWAFEAPERDIYEDLVEPIPEILLDPW